MRAFIQVKETEITSAFKEMESLLEAAEVKARWIQTLAQTGSGKVSFEQDLEIRNKNVIFSIEINLDNERQMREKVAEKADELKKAIQEYEAVLTKKMNLALDATQDQETIPISSK